ncbi:MAG: DEAD/DEAH box helicase family protein [Gammaproteobacteria bacterium]
MTTAFAPRNYQQQVLDSVEQYFRTCHDLQDANTAFYQTTLKLWNRGLEFRPLPNFDEAMPYFCLRVPTGGGKTWLAAKAVQLVNTQLLRTEHSVILWLVPSNPIREQTLRALKDRNHPYHAALREAGPINVLDLEEAKSVTRATLDSSTTVIVATRQAFQVENEECRKVYESNGALMQHFEHLSATQRGELLTGNGDGSVPYSLANVLRLRRPFVIVDEAHNNRTELGFDTLARFRPGGIMELTATPDLERTPSNVLHSVSAAELKAEEMIKLPIRLETEPDWQQCLTDAIARRSELQNLADSERRQGASYLRPVVLIQAEARRSGVETLDVERVKQELIDNHRIPGDEIVVATGEERGLEKIDSDYREGIADPDCPVKFVITQRALAEGWDCPAAYILVSMASLQSATAVEQLLGRILRQPQARHRQAEALNQSYAFVVSRNFAETAGLLRDRLVEGAGFERRDAAEFVKAIEEAQAGLDLQGNPGQVVFNTVPISLKSKPNLRRVPRAIRDKVGWDASSNTLTINQPLAEDEAEAVTAVISDSHDRQSFVQAAETSRTTAIEFFHTPAELGEVLRVPQLSLYMQGELQLFDDPELLDYPWELNVYDAGPSKDDISALNAAWRAGEGGEIDVTEQGHVVTRFITDLQRDLGLVYKPEHWDEVKLAAWLCRNIPDPSVTHANKQAFVLGWLQKLLDLSDFNLARANQQKFQLRGLIEKQIRDLHGEAVRQAYQETLFGEDREARVAVDAAYAFEFNPQVYAPVRDYDGRFGHYDFRGHYYGRIGDFDSGEEFECACRLDQLAQQGRIDFWVRNLVRREGCSFYLQKADGRFYPDFICRLPDGKILIVEYKGANAWESARDDREIGELWAELSGGQCDFVMITDKRWDWMESRLT